MASDKSITAHSNNGYLSKDLPDGWKVKTLREIAEIDTEALSSNTPLDFTFNYISLEQVDIGNLTGYTETEFRTAPSRARRVLRYDDVLMSTVRPNLKAHLHYRGQVPNAVCSTGFAVIRAKREISAPGFIFAHLFGEVVNRQVEQILVGSNYPAITSGDVGSIRIPCPPNVPEQRAIAAALSNMDSLIDALDALIAKKQAVKQATMQQLLTGAARLPGFSGEWETKRLGDTLTFLTTASNPHSDLGENGEVYYIHYGDVHAHSQPVLDCVQSNLPRIDRTLVERIAPVQDGDLVIVDASEDLEGVGKSVEIQDVRDNTIVAGLHTILCRGSSEFWATGFKAYLQFIPAFKFALTRMATGISVYAISKSQLAEVTLPLPEKSEQRAIATVLSDMDAEIAALQGRRDKSSALKQGMMQELLTGKIRLPAVE